MKVTVNLFDTYLYFRSICIHIGDRDCKGKMKNNQQNQPQTKKAPILALFKCDFELKQSAQCKRRYL